MAHAPKKEKRELPKDIVTRKDTEVAECIFGKRVKQELDRKVKEVDKTGVPDFMRV